MKNLFIILFALVVISACEKVDCNGDLDGMWQLTSWQDLKTGQQVADKHSKIFWHVKLALMQFNKSTEATYYLAHFRHTSDSLFVKDVYQSPHDTPASLDALAPYGVEADGKFHVEQLSGSRMVLRTVNHRLTFRKF